MHSNVQSQLLATLVISCEMASCQPFASLEERVILMIENDEMAETVTFPIVRRVKLKHSFIAVF